MHFSVHIYGSEVDLIQLDKSYDESKKTLIRLMDGVKFKPDEDTVIMFRMTNNRVGEPVFSYEEYFQEQDIGDDHICMKET